MEEDVFKSSNPTLNDRVFMNERALNSNVMDLSGTINKTGILLLLCLATAYYTYQDSLSLISQGMAPNSLWLWGGVIGGLIMALVTTFKKSFAPVTAPLYALLEGLALGSISAMYEYQFQGLVFQAIALTFGVLFIMLFLYKSKVIRATETFKKVLFASTGAIFLVYLVSMIMGFFGTTIPMIHEAGPVGIGFSMVVVVVASLNLIMDFDFIERGAASRSLPKYMEWYGAFALIVTLVWLYLEMLRLLSKLQSRR